MRSARPALALAAICGGYFMVILDTTVVNAALPALRQDLGTSVSGLQWVVNGYALMFAALLLTGGALGDRLGSRAVFLAGVVLFTAASIACGAAPSTGVLVGARLAQGVGAALAVPSSLALIRATHPDPAGRARALGVWGGVAGLAAAAGPVVGGLLAGSVSWRAVFLVNVPVGAVAVALTLRAVPRTAAAGTRRGLDPAAQVLALGGLGALTLALIEAGSFGWTHPLVLAGFAVAALAAVAFVLVERGRAGAMLPLDLFRSPTFSAASAAGMAINLGFYGQLFVVNLYLQQVRGLSPLVAGLALLPELGVVSVASVLSGRVSGRFGVRPTMLAGLAVGAAGLAGLVLAGADTPYPVLVAPLVAIGFGMAFTMPAVTTAVVEAAPGERAGIASGVINASRQVGGVVGVALLGTLVARPGAFLAGLHAGVLVAAAAFLSAWTVALLAVDRGGGHARQRVAA